MQVFWSLYSIAQGVQGLVIAMFVCCNCKVLKLYSTPRGQKARRGHYQSMKEGEGGRYGYISVTNPNYEDISIEEDTSNFVKVAYCEDNFIERSEHMMQSPIECAFTGELSTSLAISDIPRNPLPASV